MTTGKDGFKQVSYPAFIPWITGAIKAFYKEFKVIVAKVMGLEQKEAQNERVIASVKEENAKLKTKVEAMARENDEMKARLLKIEKLLAPKK